MKIQIISSSMLDFLKDPACVERCLNKYQNYPNNEWIEEVCGESPFIDTRFQNIQDFTLDMSEEKPDATEFENVKRLYSNLKFLTDSSASDERLWAGLCLGPFYEYVRYRWNINSVNSVIQHYYFDPNSSGRRVLTRNALSRLWWIGRLTYDENRDDKFELTRFVCEHSDYIMHFIERNTSNNLHVMRPLLEAMMEAINDGYKLNTDDAGALAKYLNLLGGMYVLDFMPEEWIKEKMQKKIQQMLSKDIDKLVVEKDDGEIKNDSDSDIAVGAKSVVVIENIQSHKRMEVKLRNKKIPTKPANLEGTKVGDMVMVGKMKYRVVAVK